MKLPVLLLLVAAAAFGCGRWMVTDANPEVAFWTEVGKRRDNELAALRAANPDKGVVIFTGGSSCAFSIDPPEIERLVGRPCYNLGGVAGAGAGFLIHETMKRCQPGDVVVLALEPHFLTQGGRSRPTQLGLALALETGDRHSAVGGGTFARTVEFRDEVNLLRPGARYFATWCAKLATGNLGYRYMISDFREGGRLETSVRAGRLASGQMPQLTMTQEGIQLLKQVKQVANSKRIDVFYSLPWAYTDAENLDHNSAVNAALVAEIALIIPVLRDTAFGTSQEKGFFADTEYHLTGDGARARSAVVALGLKAVLKKSD